MSQDDVVLGLGMSEDEIAELVAACPPTLAPCDEIAAHILRGRNKWLEDSAEVLSPREVDLTKAVWDSALAMCLAAADVYGGFDELLVGLAPSRMN